MQTKPRDGRRRPSRRAERKTAGLNVKSQLIGKLGPGGYGQLLAQIRAHVVEEQS